MTQKNGQEPAGQQPVVQGATITPPAVVNGIPTIPPVAGGGGYDEDEDEDKDEEDDD